MEKLQTTISQRLKAYKQSIFGGQPGRRGSLFRSARLQLTVFYLIIIIIFSLTLTLTLRGLAQREFDHEGTAQRGAVRNMFSQLYSVPPTPDTTFTKLQGSQEAAVRRHLDEDVIVINVLAWVVGGFLSYWYAGRTLKPIEDAHEAQVRFASDASHELRTPLANLKVENEVFLRQKSFSQHEARELIESNLEEVQRLENLSSNLLTLTHYETAELDLAPADTSSIAKTSIEQAEKLAIKKHIALKQHVPSEIIIGNLESLIQVLGLVLDNAIKYSPSKSSVFLDGIKDGDQYHFSIRDEGGGIAEEDLPYIFDRLYRGDKSRTNSASGYGLGLSLAREIVTANNGIITARNYPGGGAQFIVSLAIAK
jgi:signal transduction histidine kinase